MTIESHKTVLPTRAVAVACSDLLAWVISSFVVRWTPSLVERVYAVQNVCDTQKIQCVGDASQDLLSLLSRDARTLIWRLPALWKARACGDGTTDAEEEFREDGDLPVLPPWEALSIDKLVAPIKCNLKPVRANRTM